MSVSGLPGQCTCQQLLFNPAAGVLLVLGRPRGHAPPISRLYWRRRDATRYRPIGKPKPQMSFESPIVALTAPVMYFNVFRYTRLPKDRGLSGKAKGGGAWAGDWVGVYRADLRNGTVQGVLGAKALNVMASSERAWVSSLIATSTDGRGFYGVIGIERKVNTSTKLPGRGSVRLTAHVDYVLCSLDLEARTLQRITTLEGAVC